MDATHVRAAVKGHVYDSWQSVNVSRARLSSRHVILATGGALLLLMLALAVYNAAAYFAAGLIVLGFVAIAAEVIGFVMAVVVEITLKDRRPWAALACGLILVACAAFNIHGAEQAWRADIAHQQETARMDAQERLDCPPSGLMRQIGGVE